MRVVSMRNSLENPYWVSVLVKLSKRFNIGNDIVPGLDFVVNGHFLRSNLFKSDSDICISDKAKAALRLIVTFI